MSSCNKGRKRKIHSKFSYSIAISPVLPREMCCVEFLKSFSHKLCLSQLGRYGWPEWNNKNSFILPCHVRVLKIECGDWEWNTSEIYDSMKDEIFSTPFPLPSRLLVLSTKLGMGDFMSEDCRLHFITSMVRSLSLSFPWSPSSHLNK